MARKRDYREEYRRRLANAAKRGLSRSQARGHARHGEAPIRVKPAKNNDQLEDALKLLRRIGDQGRAAKKAGVSPERFRRFLREKSLAERRGRTWLITDNRPYEMTVISGGRIGRAVFDSAEQKSLNGRYLDAVGRALEINRRRLLRGFDGLSVIDAKGKSHPLETNLNTLLELRHAEDDAFPVIYRLVQ